MALNGGDYQNFVITTTGSSSGSYLWNGGNGSYTTVAGPLTVYSDGGGAGVYSAPAPRPKTALEWLDDETESVCRLARAA